MPKLTVPEAIAMGMPLFTVAISAYILFKHQIIDHLAETGEVFYLGVIMGFGGIFMGTFAFAMSYESRTRRIQRERAERRRRMNYNHDDFF